MRKLVEDEFRRGASIPVEVVRRRLFQDLGSEKIRKNVVPFLRALGWPPERIAVKWRYIDVTVFHTLPRTLPSSSAILLTRPASDLYTRFWGYSACRLPG